MQERLKNDMYHFDLNHFHLIWQDADKEAVGLPTDGLPVETQFLPVLPRDLGLHGEESDEDKSEGEDESEGEGAGSSGAQTMKPQKRKDYTLTIDAYKSGVFLL